MPHIGKSRGLTRKKPFRRVCRGKGPSNTLLNEVQWHGIYYG